MSRVSEHSPCIDRTVASTHVDEESAPLTAAIADDAACIARCFEFPCFAQKVWSKASASSSCRGTEPGAEQRLVLLVLLVLRFAGGGRAATADSQMQMMATTEQRNISSCLRACGLAVGVAVDGAGGVKWEGGKGR